MGGSDAERRKMGLQRVRRDDVDNVIDFFFASKESAANHLSRKSGALRHQSVHACTSLLSSRIEIVAIFMNFAHTILCSLQLMLSHVLRQIMITSKCRFASFNRTRECFRACVNSRMLRQITFCSKCHVASVACTLIRSHISM